MKIRAMWRATVLSSWCLGASCASTSATVAGPQVRTVSGGAVKADVVPAVSNKAKLLFEDAVHAFDAQKKARQIDAVGLERKFKAVLEVDNNFAEAHYNLGVLAERQGNTKDAVAHYKTALAKKPTLRQAAENLAVIAQNDGDEATAMRIYSDILSNYPDDAGSRARLAEMSRRKGDYERALELAREALFRDAKTLQAYKTMMQVYYEQKQFAMARLIALRASKLDEGDAEVAYTLGLMYLAEKEPAKARVQLKKAVASRPDFLPAHYQLSKMAFEQEDYQGAEEHLRRILQSGGKSPEVLLNLGVAYKGMGQLDKAMATYDEVQKLNPEMPELYLNRGIIIGMKGDPEKALSLLKTYISRKGEGGLGMDHPVHQLIAEQEAAIQKREEDKRIAEEVARMEAEAKQQEAAAAAEEKRKKEEEFQRRKQDAKSPTPPPQNEPAPAPKKPEAKPEAPKAEAPKSDSPKPATAPAKKSSDEPDDGL